MSLSGNCPPVVRKLSGIWASRREVREQNKEEREVSHDGPTDSFSLTGMVWEELKISSLPVNFKGFAKLVAENPLGDVGNLVPWGQRILDLCAERSSTEYPKVFLKRIKDRERSGKNAQALFSKNTIVALRDSAEPDASICCSNSSGDR